LLRKSLNEARLLLTNKAAPAAFERTERLVGRDGGDEFDRPVRFDAEALHKLERYVSLAPLHKPFNLARMRSLLSEFPTLPQVACFDTAFIAATARSRISIPCKLHAEGVRRYGFHGSSY
jgi:acetate kinase